MVICGTWLLEMRHVKDDAVKEEPVGRTAPARDPAGRTWLYFFFLILFFLLYSHEGFLKNSSKHFILKFVFLLVAFMHAYVIWFLKNPVCPYPSPCSTACNIEIFPYNMNKEQLLYFCCGERWKRNKSYIDFLIL